MTGTTVKDMILAAEETQGERVFSVGVWDFYLINGELFRKWTHNPCYFQVLTALEVARVGEWAREV